MLMQTDVIGASGEHEKYFIFHIIHIIQSSSIILKKVHNHNISDSSRSPHYSQSYLILYLF